MPKVGKKEFDYTKEGKEEAQEYAEKTGEKVEKYYGGGMISPLAPSILPSMDARSRSQIYYEGGKVEGKNK